MSIGLLGLFGTCCRRSSLARMLRSPSVGTALTNGDFQPKPLLAATYTVVLIFLLGATDSRLAASDRVYLLSTREVRTICDPAVVSAKLHCQRLASNESGSPQWKESEWRELLDPQSAFIPTIIYVHGNRVPVGEDRLQGLRVYKALVTHRTGQVPIRFIIWSWPSEQIPGIRKDYQIKAERTIPVAWQLGWFINQLPEDSQIALIGYSYGARVVSGSMHLLAGGQIGTHQLEIPRHIQRSPAKVVLMAAAYDADWIHPGNVFGNALSQMDQLLLVTNRKDPAMRFYHLSTNRKRIAALGKEGVIHPSALGHARNRIRQIDVTNKVGRSHLLDDYLNNPEKMKIVWQELSGEQVKADQHPLQQASVVPAYAHLTSPESMSH